MNKTPTRIMFGLLISINISFLILSTVWYINLAIILFIASLWIDIESDYTFFASIRKFFSGK